MSNTVKKFVKMTRRTRTLRRGQRVLVRFEPKTSSAHHCRAPNHHRNGFLIRPPLQRARGIITGFTHQGFVDVFLTGPKRSWSVTPEQVSRDKRAGIRVRDRDMRRIAHILPR